MATPRKRYFRVADKIGRKAWTNDELASLVRLMAYLNTRWAREGIEGTEAGYAEVSATDLMAITGKRRADIARKSAERWRDIAEISVEHRGDVSVILWPKFAEYQQFDPPTPARVEPPPRPASRVPRPRHTESHPSGAPKGTGGHEGKKPRKATRPPPEWALRCAAKLSEGLVGVRGAPKRPNLDAWARWIARIPGAYVAATPEAVEAGIEWLMDPAQLENAMVPEVRSGRTLYEKWSRVEAAAKRQDDNRRVSEAELFDMAMERARRTS